MCPVKVLSPGSHRSKGVESVDALAGYVTTRWWLRTNQGSILVR